MIGYRFPRVDECTINVFETDIKLKSEEQLEKEDHVNNGIKLEELLRKGTPSALAEANDMMKLMSGYDTSKKPDYKKEVNDELERIESKVILLNDILNQKTSLDIQKAKDQTLKDLYSSAKVAQSLLQKFIGENVEEERMNRLLELNGFIIFLI
jgi:ADP-ribosylation factor-binding protein GGA